MMVGRFFDLMTQRTNLIARVRSASSTVARCVATLIRVPLGLAMSVKRRGGGVKEDAELAWLIERAQRGNDPAKMELLRRYEPLIHKSARGLQGDGFEDLRLKFFHALSRYRPIAGVTFGAYIRRCLTFDAIDRTRKHGRREGRVSFCALTDDLVG